MVTTKVKPVAKKTVLDVMAARQFMYSLLERIYIEEPSTELLRKIADEEMLDSIPFTDENDRIQKGVNALHLFFEDPELMDDSMMSELRSDYTALFLGPQKLKAPPWESIYLSDKRLTFQEHTIQVRLAFEKESLQIKNYKNEPDDHIAYELDFISHLSNKAIKSIRDNKLTAARKSLNTQKSFLKDHLSLWAPEFGDRVVKHARTDFYRGFGDVLAGFIAVDLRTLDALIADVNARIRKQRDEKKAS